MFSKKSFLILIFMYIFIILIGAVNAADENNDTLTLNDDGIICIAENLNDATDDSSLMDIQVDGTTFADIQDSIENADEGDTIYLNNVIYAGNGNAITIDKTLTIDGNGCTLDAQNQSQIFLINSNNVILKNIIFTNANATSGNGGAISWMGNGGKLFDSNFTYNEANLGGAIFWSGLDGFISNCNFMYNVASIKGGAIYVDKDLTIEHSIFLENKARLDDIFAEDDGELKQVRFTFIGGENYINAIYANEDTFVEFNNVTFWDGYVENSEEWYVEKTDNEMGVEFRLEIFNESGNIIENISDLSDFIGQYAYYYGNLETGNYTYRIHHADDKYYTAIDKTGKFTIIQPSDLQSLKKLIEQASDNSIISLTKDYIFTYGVDDNLTRGIVLNKNNVTILGNGHFINGCHETRMFQIYGDDIKIYNLTFMEGSTPNDGNISEGDTYWFGGSILWYGLNGYVENCIFSDSQANADGGAIEWNGDYGTVVNSVFEFNFARSQGGGIYWNGQHGCVLNSTFRHNLLEMNNGAGLFLSGHDFYIANTLFDFNRAETGHGALYCYSHNAIIYNCTFTDNYGGFSGGAFLSYGRNVTMDRCTFIGNIQGYMEGGAIDWSGSGGKIKNCLFIGNKVNEHGESSVGGAIYCYDDDCLIDNCTFIGNEATNGGAIFWNKCDRGIIKNCTFINNTARHDGGAFYWMGVDGILSNITMIGNVANHDGGAIYWIANNGTVINSTMENNTAYNNGGAIFWIGNNGTVIDSSMENNLAHNNAGAIYWAGNNETISNINIIDVLNGYEMGNNGTLKNLTIKGNVAYNNGGGIYWKGENGKISMVDIERNIADFYGSAIYLNNNISIENSVILNNKARCSLIQVYEDSAELFILNGDNNYVNGIFANSNYIIHFNNVSYWNGEIVNTDTIVPVKNQKSNGINITLEIYDSNENLVDNITDLTENGLFIYDDSLLKSGIYTFKAYHIDDDYYSYDEVTGIFMKNDFLSHFNIPGGIMTIKCYAVDTKAGEKGISYSAKLLDSNGNPIAGVPIQFAIDGKVYNTVTLGDGSFKPYNLNIAAAGKYTMALYFAGDDKYTSAFANVCFVLSKKPIKIKAATKSYKAKTKIKKFVVTLSTKACSSADKKPHLSPQKVKLKVNGKTYSAKTNKNGKAVFKIKKLNKKGRYIAKISYTGNSIYKSATKKVKIKIK